MVGELVMMQFNMEELEQHELGYYTYKNKPSKEELAKYYSKRYFESNSSYNIETDLEIEYKSNHAKLIEFCLSSLVDKASDKTIVEIGSGQGYLLKELLNKGWNVNGIDYSKAQIGKMNKCVENHFYTSKEPIEFALEYIKNAKFCVMKHVLEHVPDPKNALENISSSQPIGAYIAVEIPNDFSNLQLRLIEGGQIEEQYWLSYPEHLSYFSPYILPKLMNSFNYKCIAVLGDFPIEVLLLQDEFNYKKHPELGKAAHLLRCKVMNYIHRTKNISEIYNAMVAFGKLEISRSNFFVFEKI